MRILGLDTSTEWCSVAVAGSGARCEANEHVVHAHSERLLPMVRRVLADAGWSPAQLDGIAFGAGPGSFTGLRIGCGVAQGLALALDLPVVPVPTLEALAEASGAGRVLCCLDARMREVYVAAYARDGVALRALLPAAVLPPDAVELPAPAEDWTGAGPGFTAYPQLAARLRLRRVDPAVLPTAATIVALARPRFERGEGVAAGDALPLYVRHRVALTQAERAAGAVL